MKNLEQILQHEICEAKKELAGAREKRADDNSSINELFRKVWFYKGYVAGLENARELILKFSNEGTER